MFEVIFYFIFNSQFSNHDVHIKADVIAQATTGNASLGWKRAHFQPPPLVCLHVSVSQAVIAEQLAHSIQWTLQWK